jgi:hypothetical protein
MRWCGTTGGACHPSAGDPGQDSEYGTRRCLDAGGRYDGRSRAACEPRQRKAGATAVRGGPGLFANQVSAFARTHGWVGVRRSEGSPIGEVFHGDVFH